MDSGTARNASARLTTRRNEHGSCSVEESLPRCRRAMTCGRLAYSRTSSALDTLFSHDLVDDDIRDDAYGATDCACGAAFG